MLVESQGGEQDTRSKAAETSPVSGPPGHLQGGMDLQPAPVPGLHGGLRPLRRHAVGADPLGGTEVDAPITEALRRRQGGGQRLPDSVGVPMGQELGIDTSALRVHADPQAGSIARSVRAEAFTYGDDLYFAPGAYQPSSPVGQRVLAHELSHVAAQRSGSDTGSPGPLSVGRADDPAEAAAEQSADRVVGALRNGSSIDPIRRFYDASAPAAEESPDGGKDARPVAALRPSTRRGGGFSTLPAGTIRRMARSEVKDHLTVRFPDMTVVNGWWIQPGTTGVVADSSGEGDVAIKLTSGDYAGEVVKVGARYFDEVDKGQEPAPQPVTIEQPSEVVLSLSGQLEKAFADGAKPTIEALQKIIKSAAPEERKQVADDDAFLGRAKKALDEDTYLGLLPALGVYRKPSSVDGLSEGGPGHTSAAEADKAIQETLQQYVAEAVKAGRSVEGEVSVVGDEDFQMAFDRQWVRAAGQDFGEDDAWDVCNAFVDVNLPKRHIWVHRDMGNTGTVIHEGMHKYADDILRDEQIKLSNSKGIAHGGVSRLDEGITEYFTRIVTDQLKMDERSNYQDEFEVAEMLANWSKIGEKTLAAAYYDGQLALLRKPFGSDWETFAEAVEAGDWDWLADKTNWQ